MTINVWLENYTEEGNIKLPFLVVHPKPHTLLSSLNKVEHKTQMYHGFFEETWGETSGSLTASASTRSFFHPNYGLVGDDRRYDTDSYEVYRFLLEFFRNNAVIYDELGSVFTQGRLSLSYDNVIYYGKFTDLRTTEDKPFSYGVDFTFEFIERFSL